MRRTAFADDHAGECQRVVLGPGACALSDFVCESRSTSRAICLAGYDRCFRVGWRGAHCRLGYGWRGLMLAVGNSVNDTLIFYEEYNI